MPPTNYSFGGGRATARPSSMVQAPSFATSTQDRISGVSRVTPRSTRQTLTPDPSDNFTNEVRSGFNNVNNFGENITQMKQLGAQRRQQQNQKESPDSVSFQQGAKNQEADFAQYSGPATGSRAQLVKSALALQGTPYAWGGGGYGNRGSRGVGKGTQNVVGVDCSGLTSYAYSTLGIRIPRTAKGQGTIGYRTSVKNLQPGDLVVWNNGSHTSMYIGNGQIVESPNVGKTVRVRTLRPGEAVTGVHIKLPGE